MRKVSHLKFIKIFLLGTLALASLFSCSKDDDINEPTVEPNLVLGRESVTAPNGQSEQTIDILSNLPWQAESNVDWITLTETSGEKGRFDLTFAVEENVEDERTGVITISAAENFSKEIEVFQEAGNRDDIYVKENGTGDGFSWEGAISLSEALEMAVTGNTIHIAEGTYTPASIVSGGDSSDDRDRTFEIRNNITLIGGYPADATNSTTPDPSQYKSILSGEGSSYHVVTVSAPRAGEEEKVVLQGLTISQGNASSQGTFTTINGTDFRRDYGGGITIGNAVVDIIDTEIVDNESEKNVAGLYAFGGSTVNIRNSKVNRNISAGNAGGVWISESTAYIYDSEVRENEGGTAAGVHAYPDANIYMYNSIIADNAGRSYGAAFYIRQNSRGLLVNTIISGNTSTSSNGGGGVMMYNNNEVTIISSTITGNAIAGPGGGLYRRAGTNTVNIYNSIISGNEQKDNGPEVDVYEDDAPAPVIESSVIGSTAYDQDGNELGDTNFSSQTMLNETEPSMFIPVGENNPAIEHGMTADELINLGGSIDPTVGEDIMAYDLLHNSRRNLNIMGALVESE